MLPNVQNIDMNKNYYSGQVFFFKCNRPTEYNSMRSELTSDNSKLHGHTNEHVQFEGAHQEINRSLLPCRHTDNDKCIGILGMHPCSTNFTSNHVSQCAKSVILKAWTFGYVAIIDSLTWHSILLMERMDIQHRIILIQLMDIQHCHWQTG